MSPGKRENSRLFWVFIPLLRGVSKAVGGPQCTWAVPGVPGKQIPRHRSAQVTPFRGHLLLQTYVIIHTVLFIKHCKT